MNEFNPFKELWINPNETQPTYDSLEDTPTESNSVMWTMWQFNPFKELNINVNWFEQPTANWKDTEVSSMLGLTWFTPMTDNEKWDYVNSLSDEEWNTWNNLKSEWYSFEARKALMDNQDQLYDINTLGSWKYLQTQDIATEDKMQSFLDWYQNNIQWFSDRYKEWSNQNINYENKGIGIDDRQETEDTAWKKIANVLNSVVSIWVDILEKALDYSMHKTLGLYNKIGSIQDHNFQPVSWDATKEWYKSSMADLIWIGADLLQWYVAVANPAIYLTLWVISQDDWIMSKILNGANDLIEKLPKWLIQQPAMQEFLNQPWNAWAEEDMINWITFGIYALLGWWLKKGWKVLGNTKAWIQFQKVKNNVARGVKESIREGKAAWERAKDYNIWENIQGTRMWRSNVRRATIQWMKEWFRKWYNAKSPQWLTDTRITPVTETTVPEEKVNNTEIINRETQELPGEETPVTEETPKTIKTVENNSELNKLAKETKLSENTIKNLESNPDLQNEFQNTIKPYLEENWKSNPEGVISKPVDDLVYEIKSGIEELKTQQSNLNRSLNNKKLSEMEKSLIREVQKIIDQKDSKRIFKNLKQLTPQQKGLVQRVVPDIESKLNTIDQILDLTKEITKRNLVERFLKFQSRPRRWLSGFTKAMIYDFVRGIYEQKWIKASTEAIDKFIEWLSDEQISDFLYKKNLSQFEELIWKSYPWENKIAEISKEKKQLKQTEPEDEQWYMNQTDVYTYDEQWNKVEHLTKEDLNIKPFDSEYTVSDILKEAWVKLTYPDNRTFLRFFAWMKPWVRWWYNPRWDFIGLPEHSPAVMIVMHELWHRIRKQFTEEERLKIQDNIIERWKKEMRNKWWSESDIDRYINGDWAEERMSEYIRNYTLYWNIFGKTAKEVLTTEVWKEFGQRIVNVMEKFTEELFDVFGAKNHKSLIDKIDSIVKLKPKWKEIIKRDVPTEFDAQELIDQLSNKLKAQWWKWDLTLEKLNKSSDIDLTDLKKETRGILSDVYINEDWFIVGKEHGHETPVYDYIEDSKLPQELKDFLKKQKDDYLKKQDEEVLARLNN